MVISILEFLFYLSKNLLFLIKVSSACFRLLDCLWSKSQWFERLQKNLGWSNFSKIPENFDTTLNSNSLFRKNTIFHSPTEELIKRSRFSVDFDVSKTLIMAWISK